MSVTIWLDFCNVILILNVDVLRGRSGSYVHDQNPELNYLVLFFVDSHTHRFWRSTYLVHLERRSSKELSSMVNLS